MDFGIYAKVQTGSYYTSLLELYSHHAARERVALRHTY